MRFTQTFHYGQTQEASLYKGSRWLYANGGTAAGSSADPQSKKEDKEDETEQKLNEERNREFIKKIETLRERNQISEDTQNIATADLQTKKQYEQSLARLLATEKIDEDLFNLTHDALQSDSSAQRALAKKLIGGKLDQATFEDALDDLESGNAYRMPLARRLALGQIDPEEFEVAHEGLDSADTDQKRASQSLALGQLKPQEFRQQMAMEPRKKEEIDYKVEENVDPVAATQKEIHDQITELLLSVNVIIEELPEQERTRPLTRLRNNLRDLNTRDKNNQQALTSYLRTLHEEEDLDEAEMLEIRNFDYGTNKEYKVNAKAFEQKLKTMQLSPTAIKHIKRLKEEEWKIERDFIEQNDISQNIIRTTINLIHYESLKEKFLEEAEDSVGIQLKEGVKVQYIYPDPERGNIRTKTIKKVDPLDTLIFDGVGDDANVIGKRPSGLKIYLDDGTEYTLGQFEKWVNASDAYQVIKSKHELESNLRLPEWGMALSDGQTLEYNIGYNVDKNGNVIPRRQKVAIASINDDKVVFDKAVVTLTPSEDPHARLTVPRLSREMELGEFAKWAHRHQMVPEIKTLEDLRDHLKTYNQTLNQKLKRNSEAFPPITLEPGEVLQMGEQLKAPYQFQIKEANDNEVKFKNGDSMTLPQFLEWVRRNDVERSNVEDKAERMAEAAKNLGEETKEEAKQKGLLEAMADFVRRSTPGDDQKSFFEKISPYLPRRADEPKLSFINKVLSQYTFVSVMDVVNLGKELLEFMKRKHTRRSKARYSKIGSALPSFLGTEFERVNQSAETEEVNQYKDAMSQWGTWQILGKLQSTNSKDEAKACLITLSDKGELRWDDMSVWNTLNRLTSRYTPDGSKLFIKLTHEPQPHPDDPKKLVSGEDRTKDAIDAMWGEGQWAEWFSGNVSKYNNNKNAYAFKCKQLEADPKGTGGLQGEIARLLTDWKNGKYVNPHEYEEIIDFAIDAGKMTAEAKMFFLIQGITARCPSGPMEGMTLLHIDRIGDLDGKYLAKFPMLDYFTNKDEKPFHPAYLEGKISLKETARGYKLKDYEDLIELNFKEEAEAGVPGLKFSQFMWETMLEDAKFKTRLSKALRNAQNMDHDDAHMFIPPATLEEIASITGAHNGTQKFFTTEGYKNGYAGYNQYLVSLSNRQEELIQLQKEKVDPKTGESRISDKAIHGNVEMMIAALQGYYLFDSYLSGRKEPENNNRARLDKSNYNEPCVVDEMVVGKHQLQLNNLLIDICNAYGIDWKKDKLFNYRAKYGDRKDQEQLEKNMEQFLRETLPTMIKSDNGKKMLEIVAERKSRAVGRNKEETSNKRQDPNALGGIDYCNRNLAEPRRVHKAAA